MKTLFRPAVWSRGAVLGVAVILAACGGDSSSSSSSSPDGDGYSATIERTTYGIAHVTAPDGRSGWLWMDETPDVSGADALGG